MRVRLLMVIVLVVASLASCSSRPDKTARNGASTTVMPTTTAAAAAATTTTPAGRVSASGAAASAAARAPRYVAAEPFETMLNTQAAPHYPNIEVVAGGPLSPNGAWRLSAWEHGQPSLCLFSQAVWQDDGPKSSEFASCWQAVPIDVSGGDIRSGHSLWTGQTTMAAARVVVTDSRGREQTLTTLYPAPSKSPRVKCFVAIVDGDAQVRTVSAYDARNRLIGRQDVPVVPS
jgi:hypothetical protein